MIQFNMLPDVKQQFLKAEQNRKTAVTAGILITAASVFIFTILFMSVNVFQKKNLSDINKDIKSASDQLKSTTDLNKVLTVQNQLKSLPALQEQKPVASRLFKYLSAVTPANISIGDLEVDFDENTMRITGTADSLQSVNKFVDTLKFTTYSVVPDDGSTPPASTQKPFSSVVLSNFTRNEKEATYTISLAYDPVIFSSDSNVVLTVPKIISTRSETEKPTELFKALPETKQQ
jgi:Tfp pilus assembly protein PilN